MEALPLLDRAVVAFRVAGRTKELIQAHRRRATLLEGLGRTDDARQALEETIAVVRETGTTDEETELRAALAKLGPPRSATE
jgi:hypothetical protein